MIRKNLPLLSRVFAVVALIGCLAMLHGCTPPVDKADSKTAVESATTGSGAADAPQAAVTDKAP
jgi:hypothetical protein